MKVTAAASGARPDAHSRQASKHQPFRCQADHCAWLRTPQTVVLFCAGPAARHHAGRAQAVQPAPGAVAGPSATPSAGPPSAGRCPCSWSRQHRPGQGSAGQAGSCGRLEAGSHPCSVVGRVRHHTSRRQPEEGVLASLSQLCIQVLNTGLPEVLLGLKHKRASSHSVSSTASSRMLAGGCAPRLVHLASPAGQEGSQQDWCHAGHHQSSKQPNSLGLTPGAASLGSPTGAHSHAPGGAQGS